MGYCVDFEGKLTIDPPLTEEQASTWREHENTERWPDGPDDRFNPWALGNDLASLTVETDKPGDWKAWLQYSIDRFLMPWGRTLSGSVTWEGGERGDAGTVTIEGGKVKARRPPALAWGDVSERDRSHVLNEIAEGMSEAAQRLAPAWLAALVALGWKPTSDRTEFDD